jgi:hypothetical protein
MSLNKPTISLQTAMDIVDAIIDEGVIVTPCIAMVEQFIKDGEFDRKRTAHNGRIAVVYIDKSKWNSPLIDITEQFYNTDKAKERIQALKEAKKSLNERNDNNGITE